MRPITFGAIIAGLFAVILLLSSIYTVQTGHVGVERTFGQVNMEPTREGMNMKLPLFTSVTEYSTRIITVDLDDLTPKANDNLSLQGIDVSVLYRVAPDRVTSLVTNFSGSSIKSEVEDGSVWLPGYGLVEREARNAIYSAVSEIDSLQLHRNRDILSSEIEERLIARLDDRNESTFIIDRVVVRDLNTDGTIEESIREAVRNEKRLEAREVQVEIAKRDADIRITEAEGVAESNRIIQDSLTPAYLQHEKNKALLEAAEQGSLVVVPENHQNFMLQLPETTHQRSPDNE